MDLTSLRVPRARAARSCRREDLSDEDFGPVLAHLVRWVDKEIPVGRTLEESPASREQSWLAGERGPTGRLLLFGTSSCG